MTGLVPGTSRLLRAGMGAAAAGLLLIYNSVDAAPSAEPPPGQAAPPAATAGASPGAASASPAASPAPAKASGPALKRSVPTRLRIPQIAVDAPFTELTLDPAGQLNAPPPDNQNLVGWYRDGVTPASAAAPWWPGTWTPPRARRCSCCSA